MSVADSAGIRLVDNGDVEGRVAPFHLAPEPLFRVGWREGEHEFGRIAGGVILSDGTIVVTDQIAREAIVLSPLGEVIGTLGRPGEGPGEFPALGRVVILGRDTLAFQDGYGSFSLFHRGGFLRRTRAAAISFLRMLGSDGRTRIYFGPPRAIEPFPTGEPDRWISLDIPAVDVRTGDVATFTTVDYAEHMSHNIFSPQTVATVTGGRVVVARQDRPEVRWLDPAGQVTQIARWETPRAEPSDRLWAVIADGRHSRWDAVMGRSEVEAGLERDRKASSGPLPYFGELLGDVRGGVWLSEYVPAWTDRPTRYFVISPEGEWLGRIDVPERLDVLAITDDRVLAVHRNELDVDAVAVYRIVGRADRPGRTRVVPSASRSAQSASADGRR